jgi:putative acetyltransferase
MDWSRAHGAHKVTLSVWPHNERALRLYMSHGFGVEGRLRRHWRRRNGELWDALLMALVLDTSSPGSPYE